MSLGPAPSIRERIRHHLDQIYSLEPAELEDLATRVLGAAAVTPEQETAIRSGPSQAIPDAGEVVLITYGDTFVAGEEPGLQALGRFWKERIEGIFSTVHVLPFFPSSSDGGFAVVDYRAVDPALGTWEDLREIAAAEVMVDLVCNHGSAQSEWFTQFVADEAPGHSFYLTAEPDADALSLVTRPRTHPLLLPVETAKGLKHVWATFSHDQVDFDFSNPDVLIEFCSILGHYLTSGATRVRLDAIAYLWKQLGTACVHLPQTHQVVKLMRTLVEARNPQALVITETNVPHDQNVSYFGDGDEAHLVYNFTLAPLIVWSFITGRSGTITAWLRELEPAPAGCAFFNFLASHDGIGLRPVEDLIGPDDLRPLIEAGAAVGGKTSDYTRAGVPRPYELSVSLSDLLAGPDGATAQRLVGAHALLLAMQGIPAIYVHSLLATPGDIDTMKQTGQNRDINRPHVQLADALEQTTSGWKGDVFSQLTHLIATRARHAAFDPASAQVVHDLGPHIVAIERGAGSGRVLAIHNMSGESCEVQVPTGFGTHDLISGDAISHTTVLAPWQSRWLA